MSQNLDQSVGAINFGTEKDQQGKLRVQERPLLRVLVVDDNIDAAKTLGWMLELMGHKAYVAYDGATALKIAQKVLPHAVLLDLGMPHMNGFELCQVMKQSADLRHTVFIAETGWEPERHESLSKEAGFDYYLVKTIEMDKLQKTLSSLLKF